MGVDDQGSPFALSPDPLLESVTPYVSGFSLGQAQPDLSALDGLLANEKIFGVDLTANGMDGLVKKYFSEMLKGPGAVNNVLEKYVQ